MIVWNDTRTRAICEELKRSSVRAPLTKGSPNPQQTFNPPNQTVYLNPIHPPTNPHPNPQKTKQVDGIDRFRDVTGLPIATYFSASKILWLLENVPGLKEAALKGEAVFGTVDTWLIYKLTGAFGLGLEGRRHRPSSPTRNERTRTQPTHVPHHHHHKPPHNQAGRSTSRT